MNSREVAELKRRAKSLGVQTEFLDSSGVKRAASIDTLRAMLELLGGTQSELHLPPVIVCWNGKPKRLSLPEDFEKARARYSLFPLAEGEGHSEGKGAVQFPVRINSSTLHFPQLPFGYFDLRIEASGQEHRSLIISAPTKAFAQRAMRDWGVFIPMYAVRSETSWGAGNLANWERLCTELSSDALDGHSGIVVATLPLLGAFLEKWKCEPSPYSPATRLFWNEFYLDVAGVPEFAASKSAQRLVNSPAFQREITSLRRSKVVDYFREMKLKRSVLEQLARKFFAGDSPRRHTLEAFLKERPELERYAAFRAACEQQQVSWHSWPERMRDGKLRRGDYDESVARYFVFAQWLAHEQMDRVLATCRDRGVKFYLDLPLGVNPDGYDVWANQHLFVNNASVGAPPDAFFTKGQDWGFPPLHPQRIREDGYRYVIDYLRFQMRHTGLLRLDHVMGLHRLWWVPRGASAADGAYVSYNAEELYAILCLQSHRHQTTLVGENLGTVPPEVNRSMKRHGVRTMYVAQYEMQPDAKQPLREPPRDCVASINTHDMPMWSAHWRGLDIADRQNLGLLKPREAREERKRRAALRNALEKRLRQKRRGENTAPYLSGAANAKNILAALLKFLSRSKAELVLVTLEDLWLETQPQNTPGTSTERVNWKRKARYSIEELMRKRTFRELLKSLAERE